MVQVAVQAEREQAAAPPRQAGSAPCGPLSLGCCPGGEIAGLVREIEGTLDMADYADHVVERSDGSAELTLIVQNLHCPSCIRTIESAVERLPGLERARVNLGRRPPPRRCWRR
jgi:hypothetical protein